MLLLCVLLLSMPEFELIKKKKLTHRFADGMVNGNSILRRVCDAVMAQPGFRYSYAEREKLKSSSNL